MDPLRILLDQTMRLSYVCQLPPTTTSEKVRKKLPPILYMVNQGVRGPSERQHGSLSVFQSPVLSPAEGSVWGHCVLRKHNTSPGQLRQSLLIKLLLTPCLSALQLHASLPHTMPVLVRQPVSTPLAQRG